MEHSGNRQLIETQSRMLTNASYVLATNCRGVCTIIFFSSKYHGFTTWTASATSEITKFSLTPLTALCNKSLGTNNCY